MHFPYLCCLSLLAAAITPVLSLPILSSDVSSRDERVALLSRDPSANEGGFADLLPRSPARKGKPNKKANIAAAQAAKAAKDTRKANHLASLKDHSSYTATPHVKNKKTPEQAHARKAKNSAKVSKGRHGPVTKEKANKIQAKAHAKQQEALKRKQNRKTLGRQKFGAAAKAHKATEGLPGRKKEFHVGKTTFTGKDARIGAFNSQFYAKNPLKHGAGHPTSAGHPSAPRRFHNAPNKNGASIPLPHMKGKGSEFPLTSGNPGGYQGGPKSAARIVTQDHHKNGKTTTTFAGVIAHDPNNRHSLDHFQVHPVDPTPPSSNGGKSPATPTVRKGAVSLSKNLPFHHSQA